MLRDPLLTIRELGREHGASNTRRKVFEAVPDAITGTPRVTCQTKQSNTWCLWCLRGDGPGNGARGVCVALVLVVAVVFVVTAAAVGRWDGRWRGVSYG